MKTSRNVAFTWPEFVMLLAVIGGLYYFIFHHAIYAYANDGRTQMLSNMKQLHIVTQQMAMDNAGSTEVGWPGDTGATFSNWAHNLVREDYLSTNDLCKLLSGPGLSVKLGKIPSENSTAIRVYAVKETSATNTVFLTTANFTNTPSGGAQPLATAKPYGKKGFVVFRRGGDGAILMTRQAGDTNLVGDFVPVSQITCWRATLRRCPLFPGNDEAFPSNN